MRPYGWIVGILVVLALVGTAFVLASQKHSAPDCAGRVVMIRGLHGAPLECVCVQGVIASCFEPGS